MDLDQLTRADVFVQSMDTVVTSVSRQESSVGRSPAAVFVITPEMIRRSAANNVPDLLRMVPGLEVARIDANKWAITARGFNSLYAGKLLVQIDGRTVYDQGFSGVFWDALDVVLQDIERIEVIRGPGATVWGANAVNGVINIITKQAKDTQGLLVTGGSGSEERGFSVARYGGQFGPDVHWRVYGKQFERDAGYNPAGEYDDWRQARGGFRTDWTPNCDDTITLQGDLYNGNSGVFDNEVFSTVPYSRNLIYDTNVFGENILFRWNRELSEDSNWTLRTFYDHAGRHSVVRDQDQRIFDIDFHHTFLWNQNHKIIYGAGYRHVSDDIDGDFAVSVTPDKRSTELYSCFVQDEIALIEDRWYLTVGSKFEHNDFTGFEYQPSVRMLYLPSERESVWAAVSRAVQTPGRALHNITINNLVSSVGPVFSRVVGNPALASEELLAFELGYRAQTTDQFSWDIALFYNEYENGANFASTGAPFFDVGIGATIVPLSFENSSDTNTYGGEVSGTYEINKRWEVSGWYSYLNSDSNVAASSFNQAYLRSSWDLSHCFEFDLIGRYVDSRPALGISSYMALDMRLAWSPNKHFEWAVSGRNLLDTHHAEFVDEFTGVINTEVQPEVFTSLTWTR